MKIRVGFGFDVHQLVAGRELWLGGIRLGHEKGLLGQMGLERRHLQNCCLIFINRQMAESMMELRKRQRYFRIFRFIR